MDLSSRWAESGAFDGPVHGFNFIYAMFTISCCSCRNTPNTIILHIVIEYILHNQFEFYFVECFFNREKMM